MLRLAATYARRELRGGIKGFRIFLACLALGVAAIAAVGSISAGVVAGLERDARAILGGDVSIRLIHRPATPAQLDYLRGASEAVSSSVEMRAMARAPDGDRRTLVELKAVDGGYPLYGTVAVDPPMPLDAVFARRDGVSGVAIEQALAIRLGLEVGQRIRVGEGSFEVRAIVEREPDRGVSAIDFGPRVLLGLDGLADTHLIQPGSLIQYHYRVRLAPGTDADGWMNALQRDLPDAGWRVRGFRQSAPGVERFVDRIGLFLTLVGLTALLVGGVGVGNAVRAYLDTKTSTIAMLKCIGAPGRLIFATYLTLVLILTTLGIAIGLAVGALAPWAAASGLAKVLPVPLAIGIYPAPLALAALFGLLTSLAFSLWPLGRAREVQAASLFRDTVARVGKWPRPSYVAATAAVIAGLAALAVGTAPNRALAGWFVLGAVASFITFTVAAVGMMRAAARAGHPRSPKLRLALANLHRPGAPTPSVVLSLGLGLTVLVTIALIEGNLSRQVAERLPERAPSFFFIDIQAAQAEEFDAVVRQFPGIGSIERVPSLRGRITRIKGEPVERAMIAREASWAVDSDRGLTYSATPPPGSKIVAGSWWPSDYRGPPLISFDARLAGGMGVGVGDTLTINILGREVDVRIASLREIDWTNLGINFTIIFAPGFLEAAPHTHIAAVRADPATEEALLRAVTDRFPTVSAIRVKDALDSVNQIVAAIGAAARVTGGITLFAGTLVLAGAMVAGHRRRVYDAVVLKVLGATRRDLLGSYILEYGLLGLATAAIAAVVGSIAAWLVVTRVMRAEWVFLPTTVLVTAILCTMLTVAIGFAGTWRVLGQKAAPLLRTA